MRISRLLGAPLAVGFFVVVGIAPQGCVDDEKCSAENNCSYTTEVAACSSSADCAEGEFCDFLDGLCGAGESGLCTPSPEFCSDGEGVCYCDGSFTTFGGIGCQGHLARDWDATGSCSLPATQFACAHRVCDKSQRDYCVITADDTGGAPQPACGIAPAGCDPVACACLTAEIDACGGTCEDGPDGPTIHCPGG